MEKIASLFEQLKTVPQPPAYHPEGNVYTHTVLVWSFFNLFLRPMSSRYPLIAAAFHDLGKLTTTKDIDGKITAHGHEAESLRLYELYEPVLFPNIPEFQSAATKYVIKNHMKAKRIHEMRPAKVAALKEEAAHIETLPGRPKSVADEQFFEHPLFKILTVDFVHADTMVGVKGSIPPNYFLWRFNGDPNHPNINHLAIDPFNRFIQHLQTVQNVAQLHKSE